MSETNKMPIKDFMKENFITCECGYNNSKKNVRIYGRCLRCDKVLDEEANFNRQLFLKMKERHRRFR